MLKSVSKIKLQSFQRKKEQKIDYDLAVKKIVDAGYNVEKAYHNPTGLRVEQIFAKCFETK